MKPLSVSIDTGSSAGYHYWKGWHECPMRRYLQNACLVAGIPALHENENMQAGSVFHAYLRLFFSGNVTFETQTVRFTQSRNRIWMPSEAARDTGAKLFKSFRAKYNPDVFGKVTAIERPFEIKKASWLPKGMILTGRTDLETRISQKHADKIQELFGVSLRPGDYLVDHKSAGSTRFLNSYRFELQFVAYLLARASENLRGLLVNVGIKSNPPQHKLLFIDLPNDNETQVLYDWLLEALVLSQEEHTRLRPAACYSYSEASSCPFLSQCPRK